MSWARRRRAEVVADGLAAKSQTLPAILARTLTWDQGQEMAEYARFTIAIGVRVYFCDLKSPWQRGSNWVRWRLRDRPVEMVDRSPRAVRECQEPDLVSSARRAVATATLAIGKRARVMPANTRR